MKKKSKSYFSTQCFISERTLSTERGVKRPIDGEQNAHTLGHPLPASIGKKVLLKIPSGIESGKIFRISKEGIPHFSGYGRGNLYVEFVIETPKKLTNKQKELLDKLRENGL